MLNLRIWTLAVGSCAAINFVMAVVVGLIAPPLPITHGMLETALPGFVWISPGSFVFGFVEAFLIGAYGGFLFAWVHNVFSRRMLAVAKPAVPHAKAA